jgi:hypothetical protein
MSSRICSIFITPPVFSRFHPSSRRMTWLAMALLVFFLTQPAERDRHAPSVSDACRHSTQGRRATALPAREERSEPRMLTQPRRGRSGAAQDAAGRAVNGGGDQPRGCCQASDVSARAPSRADLGGVGVRPLRPYTVASIRGKCPTRGLHEHEVDAPSIATRTQTLPLVHLTDPHRPHPLADLARRRRSIELIEPGAPPLTPTRLDGYLPYPSDHTRDGRRRALRSSHGGGGRGLINLFQD